MLLFYAPVTYFSISKHLTLPKEKITYPQNIPGQTQKFIPPEVGKKQKGRVKFSKQVRTNYLLFYNCTEINESFTKNEGTFWPHKDLWTPLGSRIYSVVENRPFSSLDQIAGSTLSAAAVKYWSKLISFCSTELRRFASPVVRPCQYLSSAQVRRYGLISPSSGSSAPLLNSKVLPPAARAIWRWFAHCTPVRVAAPHNCSFFAGFRLSCLNCT